MVLGHDLEIVWDDLMDAFASGEVDRVYFLDRQSGEIFFVPSAIDDEEFWHQMENNQDRFVEIPPFDYNVERRIMTDFVGTMEDAGLKRLMDGSLTDKKLHGDLDEILAFYPEEFERLQKMKDEFITSRVKNWLEENDLFTVETEAMFVPRI